MYAKYLEKHARPFIGRLKAGAVGTEALDSLYAELRRCRIHCTDRRVGVDHRTPLAHTCDDRCRPHACRPLSPTTIRHRIIWPTFRDRAGPGVSPDGVTASW